MKKNRSDQHISKTQICGGFQANSEVIFKREQGEFFVLIAG
jgi:hypothetical protein